MFQKHNVSAKYGEWVENWKILEVELFSRGQVLSSCSIQGERERKWLKMPRCFPRGGGCLYLDGLTCSDLQFKTIL